MSFANQKMNLFVEFKESSMHALEGDRGSEVALEREPNGRITSASAAKASEELRRFIGHHSGHSPLLAYCSIPARGVSLRRLSIPAAEKEDARRLLSLQLEAQLPVSPGELAWGHAPLPSARDSQNGSASMHDFLVVAIKKEFLEDYTRILAGAGLDAECTVGALARQALCFGHPEQFSVLEAGRARSELASFDSRGATALRVLAVGTETSPGAGESALRNGSNHKLYLTGQSRAMEPLARSLGPSVEILNGTEGDGRTPANLGLRKLIESGVTPLFLASHETVTTRPSSPKWKWAVYAAVLAATALVLRYAEATFYRARLSKKLAAISAYRATLPAIDREFNFLNYIKTNQPPYLDVVTVLGQAAPPGTRIDTLSIVRRGDLSLRGSAGEAQAPGLFRSKLIDSGFFSRVVVEEQAPSGDGQKFTFRISAQLKPDGARKAFSLHAPDAEKKNTNGAASPAGPKP